MKLRALIISALFLCLSMAETAMAQEAPPEDADPAARAPFAETLTALDLAVAESPDRPEVYRLRAAVRRQAGDFSGAVQDLSQALAMAPDDLASLYQRATLLFHLGDYPGALADCERVTALTPDHPSAYLMRGTIYQSMGRWRLALADFQKAFDLSPDDPILLNQLAWFFATCPDDDLRDGIRGLVLARRAAEHLRDPAIFDSMAAAYAELGQFDIARAIQQSVVEMSGGDTVYRKRLALYEQRRPWRQPSAKTDAAIRPMTASGSASPESVTSAEPLTLAEAPAAPEPEPQPRVNAFETVIEAAATAENSLPPSKEPALSAPSSKPTLPLAAPDTGIAPGADDVQGEAPEFAASNITAAVNATESAIPESEAQEMFPSPPPQSPPVALSGPIAIPDVEATESPSAEFASSNITAVVKATDRAIPESEAQEMFPSPPPPIPPAVLADAVAAPAGKETESPPAALAGPQSPTATVDASVPPRPATAPGLAVVDADADFAAPADAMESNPTDLSARDAATASEQDAAEAAPSVLASPLAAIPPPPFTIQIASLSDVEMAAEIVGNLKKKTEPAFCAPAQIAGRGTWFRIYWGRFANRFDAEEAVRRLRERRFRDPIVVRRPWSLVFDPGAPSPPELLARIGLAEAPDGRIGAFETESDARWAAEALKKEGLKVDIVGPRGHSPAPVH